MVGDSGPAQLQPRADRDSSVSQAAQPQQQSRCWDDLTDNAGRLNYKGAAITTEAKPNNWWTAMSVIRQPQVVAALPAPLEANSLYYVRAGYRGLMCM